MKEYSKQYKQSLHEDVIPFWEKYSPDWENGGFFTCLNADGGVFDTDKFVWLQARQVWTFSKLCLSAGKRKDWFDIARSGAEFLRKHGKDEHGDYYFSLTRQGRPLVAPYNIFSDCFAAMAFATYSEISHESWYRDESLRIFKNIGSRADNPKGKYNKAIDSTRPLQNFALPMIRSNLAMELKTVLPPEVLEHEIEHCLNLILGQFWHKETNLLLENVSAHGSFSDSFEGRLINPGHGLEACWFLMNIAEKREDPALISQMVDLSLNILQYGWDTQYEGIFYFLDINGYPPQQLEWDQKLWWVHLEALIVLTKGYRHSGDQRCLDWFEKVHNYTWDHFRDPRGGLEWYGYLNRQGEVLLNLKGGKWKGCFHVPRAMWICAEEWSKIESTRT